MSNLPTGTITFLFTDIAGSTQLWERHPLAMPVALALHHALLREAIETQGGQVFQIIGDAFCVAFSTAPAALRAALVAQRALRDAAWGPTGPIRVRMALHTATVTLQAGDYPSGPHFNRLARLLSAGHGGQTLLSAATHELLREHLPADVTLHELGAHQLKDLSRPEPIFQLVAPDLPTDFPPLRTLDPRRSNLPIPATTLIGRTQELADLVALLAQPTVRLVTLTGPGGTGKTRLALQVAAEVTDMYPDGTWFVDLSPVTDPGQVVAAIAQALGIREAPGQPIQASVISWLRPKQLLLLLDNCEQVVDDVAELVTEVRRQAVRVLLLATSRVPLRLAGEQEWPIAPLALPDLGMLPALDQLGKYDAVALFIARARAVRPDFTVTDVNAPAVAEICARLDGLPLALELAAARLRLFSAEQLLKRLGTVRLGTLTGGARDLSQRQRTMRATIAWSERLLAPTEQLLFARLGVFVGGWTLEAAETICENEALDVVAGLEALVAHSLVRAQEVAGTQRYTMLETIREYALEQLAACGAFDRQQAAHLRYYTAWAEAAEPLLRSHAQLLWLAYLDADNDNLLAALTWANTQSTEDRSYQTHGLRLSSALWLYWLLRNRIQDAHRWLMANWTTDPTLPGELRAHVLVVRELALGWFEGIRHYRRWLTDTGLTFVRTHGDARTLTMALADLTFFKTQILGDAALSYAQECRVLAVATRDAWVLSYAQLGYGAACYFANGRTDAGLRELRHGLEMVRQTGERWLSACAAWTLGFACLEHGDYISAGEVFRLNLQLSDELASPLGRTYALWGLAVVAENEGNFSEAYDYHRAHIETESAVGNLTSGFFANLSAGNCATRMGNFALAGQHFDRADAAVTIDVPPSHHRYAPAQFDRVTTHIAMIWLALEAGSIPQAVHSYEELDHIIAAIRGSQWARDEVYQAQVRGLALREAVIEAWLAFAQGDLDTAQRRCDQALSIDRQCTEALHCAGQIAARRELHNLAMSLINEAIASCAQGWLAKWDRTRLMLMQATIMIAVQQDSRVAGTLHGCLTAFRRALALPCIAQAIETAASLAIYTTQVASGARLSGAAAALREQIGVQLWPVDQPDYERRLAQGRAALGDEAFDAAWTAGRALSWEQAVEEALAMTASRVAPPDAAL